MRFACYQVTRAPPELSALTREETIDIATVRFASILFLLAIGFALMMFVRNERAVAA